MFGDITRHMATLRDIFSKTATLSPFRLLFAFDLFQGKVADWQCGKLLSQHCMRAFISTDVMHSASVIMITGENPNAERFNGYPLRGDLRTEEILVNVFYCKVALYCLGSETSAQ